MSATAFTHDLTRDCGHVRPEHSGCRPSGFSRWHRDRLPAHCYAADVDLVEVRASRGIVAFLELSEVDGLPTVARARGVLACKRVQTWVLGELRRLTGLPCWVVVHDAALSTFVVLDLDGNAEIMSELEFRDFLRLL